VHLSRPSRLAELVRELPFAVDDFDAASEAFVQWHRTRTDADRGTVELWAYCYVVWYFYAKFSRERTSGVSDLDAVLDRAYRRILRSLDSVRHPERFPQFVSVVCRNVLLSHRSRRRETVELQEHTSPVEEVGAGEYDRVLTRRLITRAVEALPPAIREVAQMRLLEGRSYQDIADTTGRPIASVRTYYSKAMAHLRQDPDLQDLHDGTAASSAEDTAETSAEVRSRPSGGLTPRVPPDP
jgi:RNA polymerase sigma factor (sigma-70 family)